LRIQAKELLKKGNYSLAITKTNAILANGKATALDYNRLGYCYLMTKQYGKALKVLQEAAQQDPTELLVQLNLAHAYLLNGKYKSAKSIHKTYFNQNVNDRNDDFNAILKILE
jgi:Tfp pilus assembly protein PilF